jgi:hypothetical protein
MTDEVVFATPCFQIVAKNVEGSSGPHYSLQTKELAYRAALASRSIAIAS